MELRRNGNVSFVFQYSLSSKRKWREISWTWNRSVLNWFLDWPAMDFCTSEFSLCKVNGRRRFHLTVLCWNEAFALDLIEKICHFPVRVWQDVFSNVKYGFDSGLSLILSSLTFINFYISKHKDFKLQRNGLWSINLPTSTCTLLSKLWGIQEMWKRGSQRNYRNTINKIARP